MTRGNLESPSASDIVLVGLEVQGSVTDSHRAEADVAGGLLGKADVSMALVVEESQGFI